jgi:hypothetical protein
LTNIDAKALVSAFYDEAAASEYCDTELVTRAFGK